MFFIDKNCPQHIEDAFFHKDILNRLQIISKDESIPHLIFYGPNGSGKKALINLFLKMLYDDTVMNIENSVYKVAGSGNNETDVIVKQSNYHIIIEPNNNNFDRYLIQEVVQEYAKRMPLNVFSCKKVFKTVLINNVDNLSYYAQTALRRMMEKYSDTCRFILWCRSLSRVIEPLNSRCLSIRVPSPTDNELFAYVYKLSVEEDISMSLQEYTDLISESNGNIKEALWGLELKKAEEKKGNVYIDEIKKIVNIIMLCKIEYAVRIRALFYNIMITNIEETKIFRDVLDELLICERIPVKCKYDIITIAALYEHNLMRCRREIVHLEAFVQAVMHILYKSSQYKIQKSTTQNPKNGNEIIKSKVNGKSVTVKIST